MFVLILFIGSTGIDFRTIRERSSIYSSSYNESYIEGRNSIVRVAAALEKKSPGLTTMLFGIAAVITKCKLFRHTTTRFKALLPDG